MAEVRTPELCSDKSVEADEIEMGSLDPSQGFKLIEEGESSGTTFVAPTPLQAKPDLKIKVKLPIVNEVKEEEKEEEAEEEEEEKEVKKKKPLPKKPTKTVRTRQSINPNSKKRSNTTVKGDSTPHVAEIIADKIGSLEALPVESEGRTIHYLANKEGPSPVPRAVKLTELPTNTYIVISSWRKIESLYGPSYILYVENDPTKAYWSNSRVNAIISGGMINPESQVLTIHRLLNGTFIYGYAEKK